MPCPFDGEQWKDAIVLSAVWSGAPGRSGEMALAIRETARETKCWQWDDELFTKATSIAQYRGKYELRNVVRIVSYAEECGACACRPADIAVRGESGWRADLLAMAWYRDGDNDCLPTPLPSIFLTLSDSELADLWRERKGLRDDDLITVSWAIGHLKDGSSSASSLLRKSLELLAEYKGEDRAEVIESIEEEAEAWKRKERDRKLAKWSGQFERAVELKELDLLCDPGGRATFANRVAEFRAELERCLFVDGELSSDAKRVLADEEKILAATPQGLDYEFSREELEEMTNYEPTYLPSTRGKILKAWSKTDPLPSRFGNRAPQSISSNDPLRFLRWLFGDSPEATLAALVRADPKGARDAVERILRITLPAAKRLQQPEGFSGMHAGMARGLATNAASVGRAVQTAADSCQIDYDSALTLPSK